MKQERGDEFLAEPIESTETSRSGRHTNEALFGKVIVSSLGFGLAAVLVFGGILAYQALKTRPSERSSIATLSQSELVSQSQEEEKHEESKQSEEHSAVSEPASPVDAKTLEVVVLNGGAAKGSAGVLAESLKKVGYLKTTAGNSESDFSGVVVYFKEGNNLAAKAVLESVAKTYPKATTLPSDPKKSETTRASIVVILGKE